jgi:hypothetical protein
MVQRAVSPGVTRLTAEVRLNGDFQWRFLDTRQAKFQATRSCSSCTVRVAR